MITPVVDCEGFEFSPMDPFEAHSTTEPQQSIIYDLSEKGSLSVCNSFKLEATFPENPAATTVVIYETTPGLTPVDRCLELTLGN